MVEAVVEFDYTAQEPDELTIRKGDVIREIVKIPGGWWEGTLRDKRGMFPDNFVTVILKENKVQHRPKPGRTLRQCRAVFSYHPAHDDELSLVVGDIIEVLGEVEEGWWKGRIGDSEGVFPSNFVSELDPNKSHSKHSSKEDLTSVSQENEGNLPNLPPKPSKILCQVKFPYDACNNDELTLREGDLITLINKDGQDRGWWKGELNGRIGVFPDNFVTVVPIPEVNGPPVHKQDRKLDKISPNKISPQLGNELPKHVAALRTACDLKPVSIIPPVPGKKPNVPKKSPSAVSNSGVMAGLKQKLVDMVDGASSSRIKQEEKEKEKDKDIDFDQVERSAMLLDMRANRAKAPGRRPPSTVYRDNELVNGNTDHSQPETKKEPTSDEEECEKKPKVREWEKNKAPWVAELKQNQAKRSTVPLPTPNTTSDHSRLKLTPTNDKTENHEITDTKIKSPHSHDTESSPDMSKSMSALSTTKIKTPINDMEVMLRSKTPTQPITITPIRPQSIHSSTSPLELGLSPVTSNQSHSPVTKPPIADKTNVESKTTTASPRTSVERKSETVSVKQYLELVDKVSCLETKMQQKLQEMQSQIDELQGKLKVESDLRKHFQVELEKVAQCVTQV